MTSSQLILVSVTSALVAVFAMLVVATIKRARARDADDVRTDEVKIVADGAEKKEGSEP
jgi:hypothetical protein